MDLPNRDRYILSGHKITVENCIGHKCTQEGASLVACLVRNPPAIQEAPVRFLDGEDSQRRDRLPTPIFLGFPGSLVGKESA